MKRLAQREAMKRKGLTRPQFNWVVNEMAARLHAAQGQTLGLLSLPLRESYVINTVDMLASLYQRHFIATDKEHYTAFPAKPNKGTVRGEIFEVWWLVAALLGLALARQAAVIHREPRGTEPEDADARIKQVVLDFLETDPEEALAVVLGEPYKERKDGSV